MDAHVVCWHVPITLQCKLWPSSIFVTGLLRHAGADCKTLRHRHGRLAD